MSPDVDVLVVGAGPAGSAAAIHTAQANLRTLVVDRAVFPRDKCCGDGLTALALRELEGLGLRPEEVASWYPVSGVTLRSPSGRQQDFPLPEGASCYAAVARRVDLDNALVELARAADAEVADGHALRDAAAAHDGASIRAQVEGLGWVTARWVIGADGMWSPLRKALGLNPAGYRGEWHAFRQYFSNVGPRADELTVWFEADLLPGYAWSFPLGDRRVNLGFGIQRGGRHAVGQMKQLWHDLLARPHVKAFLGPDAEPGQPQRAWPIPARVGRLPLAAGHALFVGDAAGLSDPLTGEGIGQALVSGRLAAESVIADYGRNGRHPVDRSPARGNRRSKMDTTQRVGTLPPSTTIKNRARTTPPPTEANHSRTTPPPTEINHSRTTSSHTGTNHVKNASSATEINHSRNTSSHTEANRWGTASSDYTSRVRSEFVADDRMSRFLISLLSRPATARGALRLAGATDWTRRNFARWMFEDYPRALVATPRRWRRGILNRPGAFAAHYQPHSST